MKSIINVRRSSICWRGRRELITDVRKPEIALWRHCRRRAIYRLLRSPSQTCHAKPKTQINRRRTLPASFPVGCLPVQFGLKDFSPKSQDAVALQQIKERGALPKIDRYICPQSTVAAISGLHCRALVMVSSSIRLTAWLQKFKEAGRNGRWGDWCMSRVTAIISALGYLHHRLPNRLLIITVITSLPTKPSATKCQRTEAGERGNYWHADASAWCCCARCKIHEGVSWC